MLASGDLLVFGGANRRIFHGVPKVIDSTAPDWLGLPARPAQHHHPRDGPRGGGLGMTATWMRRVDALAWPAIIEDLDSVGCAPTGPMIGEADCAALIGLYDDDRRFRSTVDMARHRFGKGEYRYFAQPLPDVVVALRDALWPHLLEIARDCGTSGSTAPPRGPTRLDDWLAACHAAGQPRPTPLLLRYGPGDWNALHRDLYGDLVFPLQVVIGLDEPGDDYTGGEFVVVEQRPRAQSRATVTTIPRGSRGRLHDPRPAGAHQARMVGSADAPRRQHRAHRPAARARPHLPRRGLTSAYRRRQAESRRSCVVSAPLRHPAR